MTTVTEGPSKLWADYIGPFAAAIGKEPDAVTTMLKGLVGDPGEEAINLLKDAKFTPDADIIGAVGESVPKAVLAKAIAGLRSASVIEAPVAVANLDILPNVPSDDAWLDALKTGGVLKFNKETVLGTVSAALAAQVGLYDLPAKIVAEMERHAQSLEEPVGEEFYRMSAMLTERKYAEIFRAIPGMNGKYATETRKKELLQRINSRLWNSLTGFHGQLKGWMESWQQGMANPAMLVSLLAGAGAGASAMPPGMMAPPATDVLRDAAESVVNDINFVFAGTGIPVALALAYDAQQIRRSLEDPTLPAQVGVANREQMLKKLGAAVSSDYPRLERSLKQYALGVIELPNVTPGQTELQYLAALFQLGNSVPWGKLGQMDSGIGSRRPGQL